MDRVMLSRKKKQWEDSVNLSGFEYDDEFTSFIFGNQDM